MCFRAALVNLEKLVAAVQALVGCERSHDKGAPRAVSTWLYLLLTVKRLRPFARRRFNTRRPFFVLILTRKPCVRLRCRTFG